MQAPQDWGRTPFRRIMGAFGAALALGLGTGGQTARAGFLYVTPSASTAGGQSVDAQADITVTAGHVHIDLTNLQRDPTSDIQTLNGIQFVLSSGQTTGTGFTSSSLFRQIDGDDPNPIGWHDVGTGPTTWNLNGNVGGGLEFTSIGNSGGAPTLIGGPRASDNTYAAANGSIAGSGPHNPFLAGTASFDLDITGLSADATISSMQFEFGTMSGTNVDGEFTLETRTVTSVPEPASVVMMGTAVAAGLGYSWRRRALRRGA
jgi:hypothetical protein